MKTKFSLSEVTATSVVELFVGSFKILLSIVLLVSCTTLAPPQMLRSNFVNCYDGKDTGISSKLEVDGFYRMGSPRDRYGINGERRHVIDTLFINFMLFRDGMIVYNFDGYSETTKGYLEKAALDEKEKKRFSQNFHWGRYILSGDTIKAQWFNHPSLLAAPWIGHEEWFMIIDRETLKYIRSKPISIRESGQSITTDMAEYGYSNARFIELEFRPDSTSWLKDQDWFWCR